MSDRLRSRVTKRRHLAAASACFLALAGAPGETMAQGFALYVAPPRLDLQAKPAETRRHVLEFHHVGQATGTFRLYTTDWTLNPDGTVQFQDALAPDSCRPWVALERRELKLAPDGRYRFRFEITPPAGTPQRECRFAIMIEGLDTTPVDQGSFKFPVAGRIGVIAYVQVGGASPRLSIGKSSLRTANGVRQPIIEVTNTGNATGRLDGFLSAVDARGAEIEFAPENVPILPGVTRGIALNPVGEEGKKPPDIQYPLAVKGTLEWGKNRETLELRFAP